MNLILHEMWPAESMCDHSWQALGSKWAHRLALHLNDISHWPLLSYGITHSLVYIYWYSSVRSLVFTTSVTITEFRACCAIWVLRVSCSILYYLPMAAFMQAWQTLQGTPVYAVYGYQTSWVILECSVVMCNIFHAGFMSVWMNVNDPTFIVFAQQGKFWVNILC